MYISSRGTCERSEEIKHCGTGYVTSAGGHPDQRPSSKNNLMIRALRWMFIWWLHAGYDLDSSTISEFRQQESKIISLFITYIDGGNAWYA